MNLPQLMLLTVTVSLPSISTPVRANNSKVNIVKNLLFIT